MSGSRAARENPDTAGLPPVAPPSPVELTSAPVHLLTEGERKVLAAFSQTSVLTLGQLRSSTAMEAEELAPVLESLRRRGLMRRLNTVIESYSCRAEFTGSRKVGAAATRNATR